MCICGTLWVYGNTMVILLKELTSKISAALEEVIFVPGGFLFPNRAGDRQLCVNGTIGHESRTIRHFQQKKI